jgi:predicted dehydrogenase
VSESSPAAAGNDPLRVGIVGCGLIGRKRAEALGDDRLVACYDALPEAAEALASEFGAEADPTLDALLGRAPDVVVVATPHDRLASIAVAALEAGAHVLVEKPAGIGVADVERIAEHAERSGRRVKVGFNHRFHPAISRAVEDARSGRFGEVMFARARYGHGGRPGYEREWRMSPEISGGGELIDQGMHLLDIFHWLLGPLPLHSALLRTQYWNAAVEDNAVLTLADGSNRAGRWAAAHVTWTEWKNMFSLEIYCRTAKLQVDGLARSYGPQRLTTHAMRPEMGPPDTEVVEYPPEDVSWAREWEHFRDALVAGDDRGLLGDLVSARYAWSCVEGAYEMNGWAR